jgi:subfamily B ATP-binding cassette protein MsbA
MTNTWHVCRYDTYVGEKGIQLSGGQRQRLAIARALLQNAPVLILDEATSSLDTLSERLVNEAIARLVHGRTVLVIAHRLSTIQRADRIIVMQDGSVVETGRSDDLISRGGPFAELVDSQQLALKV